MDAYIDKLCIIDPAVPYGIRFTAFGKELASMTDWFYAEEGKGCLFLRHVTQADARRKSLPVMTANALAGGDAPPGEGSTEVGFLYIVLVCAAGSSGIGKRLVEVAERFAIMLGLQFVLLSSLPHVVAYYFDRLGYTFIDHAGKRIDVSPWVVEDGGKERLHPDLMNLSFVETDDEP